ncbi:DUF2225 domain-containing protein [candidate division KSB1 bacterium]
MECPICKEFDEKDNFACPNCNRENICGSHYDFDFLVCSECADKMRPAVKKKADVAKKAAPAAEGESDGTDPNEVFYVQKVKCPVCGTGGEQKWFKAKTYSERNVDIDKHPQKYMWTDKAYEIFHPPLYYMWNCSNCNYTDSYVEFEKPDKDPFSNFRRLKDVFVDQYHDDLRIEKIIDKLGENINYEKMNYYQAIKLHLLGIFIQEMMEDEEDRDYFKIGRYYLRLGWLYRELNEKEESNKKIKSTLEKLVMFLKKGWPDVVDNEVASMKNAITNLNKAFTHSHAIKSVVAEVDLLMLIAGVHLKIDEQMEGLKLLNTVLARGQKTKQILERKLKEAEKAEVAPPPEELRKFDIQLKKLDALMGNARDTISDIKSEQMKKEKKKALAIMKKLGERPPQEIREILIKKGIDKRIALQLTPEEKKKFLGLF